MSNLNHKPDIYGMKGTMNLPIQKGLQYKKPSFFIGKSILFSETYGDDKGMGDMLVDHFETEDGEIIFYTKDNDRWCDLEHAKRYMLTNRIETK